ncbi:hypothetical protein TWF481_007405 [Arthrobotrys musiformis]|uniref:Nephrocystin 3-like N-terminal domain-containing protein n=1 Tax=Arthrobotrys musiformis TaxID=47236 RepID=A0AAV9WBC3_9PEZI
MAELGASVVAFIQITAAIVTTCKRTYDTMKEAQKVIKLVKSEMKSLQIILEGYKEFLDAEGQDYKTKNGGDGATPLKRCRQLVDELNSLLPDPPNNDLTLLDKIALGKRWLGLKSKAEKLVAEISREKATILLEISDYTARDVRHIKLLICEGQRDKICDWVESRAQNPTYKHNESLGRHDPQTSGWVTRMGQWEGWLNRSSGSRLVWLFGIPGAGKTILTSFLIQQSTERFENTPGVMVIYYYCIFSHEQDATEPFLRWVLSQMIRKVRVVPDNIGKLHKLNHSPSIKILEDAIEALLEKFTAIHIVVDGLDESQQCENLANVIVKFSTNPAFQKIWLLASSRKISDIATPFTNVAIELSMSNPELQKDIRAFVKATLPEIRALSKVSDMLPEIEEKLSKQADGMCVFSKQVYSTLDS